MSERPPRAVRRRRPPMSERLHEAERSLAGITRERDTLADVLNAILLRDGGSTVVATEYVLAATRRQIDIRNTPSGIVVTALGLEPRRERSGIMARLGLVRG